MFRFPSEVDGWLLESEGLALHEWAIGKRVLEIGSYCGRSTICMAQSAREVVSVDPHDGRGLGGKATLPEFLRNLDEWGLRDAVTVMVGVVGDVPLKGTFDGVFIDGCHSYESVRRDIAIAESVLETGGEIAFHDYWRGEPGVVRAVNEYMEEGARMRMVADRVAIVKPPRKVKC